MSLQVCLLEELWGDQDLLFSVKAYKLEPCACLSYSGPTSLHCFQISLWQHIIGRLLKTKGEQHREIDETVTSIVTLHSSAQFEPVLYQIVWLVRHQTICPSSSCCPNELPHICFPKHVLATTGWNHGLRLEQGLSSFELCSSLDFLQSNLLISDTFFFICVAYFPEI